MQLKERYDRDGFVFVEKAFDLAALTDFEQTIIRLADKLLVEVGAETPSDPYQKLRKLCRDHKAEFYKLCYAVGGTLAGTYLFNSKKIRESLAAIVGPEVVEYYLLPFFVFFNDRGSERLQYDFHQEAGAFPTVKDNIHMWAPLFRDLSEQDGPMVVLRGSHKQTYPYQAVPAPHSVTQLHIDPKLIEKFERVPCSLERGSVVIFHKNCVHASGTNMSVLPRISCASRFINLKGEAKFEPYVHYYFTEEDSRKKVSGGVK